MLAPMLLKVFPPSVLTCHCTFGVGAPLAAAVNDTSPPAVTDWLAGLVVMTGAGGSEGILRLDRAKIDDSIGRARVADLVGGCIRSGPFDAGDIVQHISRSVANGDDVGQ